MASDWNFESTSSLSKWLRTIDQGVVVSAERGLKVHHIVYDRPSAIIDACTVMRI